MSLKLQEITVVSQFRSSLSCRIKEGLQYNAVARNLLQALKEGRTRRFWEKGGPLYTKGISFSSQGGITYVGTC